jgi:hypothetical protein
MTRTLIYFDGQASIVDLHENMGILVHFRAFAAQILETFSSLRLFKPRIHSPKKNLGKTGYIYVCISYLWKVKKSLIWKLSLFEARLLANRADLIIPTFYYNNWLKLYTDLEVLSKLIVCNHDCINENLREKIHISEENQVKRQYLNSCKAIYVPSKWTREQTLKYYPEVKNKLFLIPHVINYEPNELLKILEMRFLRMKELENLSLKLLHVGGRESYKNFELVLTMLASSNELTHLIILGGGYSEKLAEELNKLKALGHKIDFLPFVSESIKIQHYIEADILLVPSLDEGFSFPTFEAAKYGLPILKYSNNDWGFTQLVIGNNFSMIGLKSSLKRYYNQNTPNHLFSKICREIDANNSTSSTGLAELFGFLGIAR